VEIYIAVFAGLLSTLLLGVVYLADRYEREPIELIQNTFLAGLMAQLVIVFAVALVAGPVIWDGGWLLVTVVGVALVMPFQLQNRAEMDERFDGIVYTVAFAGGATCVIHLNNLPSLIAASPFRAALELGAEPDLRDLLILADSTGFAAEFGRGLVVVLVATVVGAVLGSLHMRGVQPWRSASICGLVATTAMGINLLADGAWVVRGVLAIAAVGVAVALKRRSVFRDRPEPTEGDLLTAGLKTVLMIFGAVLLATVLLQVVLDRPELHGGDGGTESHSAPRLPSSQSP